MPVEMQSLIFSLLSHSHKDVKSKTNLKKEKPHQNRKFILSINNRWHCFLWKRLTLQPCGYRIELVITWLPVWILLLDAVSVKQASKHFLDGLKSEESFSATCSMTMKQLFNEKRQQWKWFSLRSTVECHNF